MVSRCSGGDTSRTDCSRLPSSTHMSRRCSGAAGRSRTPCWLGAAVAAQRRCGALTRPFRGKHSHRPGALH